MTRQAVAKQLGALADAGLLHATRVGRETRYEVTPQPLGDAAAWLVEMGGRWDERLAALGQSPWLGPEPLDSPAAALAAIAEAVVQPVSPCCQNSHASGTSRKPPHHSGRAGSPSLAELGHAPLEPVARLDRPALRRGDRRQPRAERPRARSTHPTPPSGTRATAPSTRTCRPSGSQ